ncbi:diguanylate cyclase [Hydrogenimonas thermophila]|uniref:Diguanylate cyclase (GGDEF) domain-containing protein n=1 Tax=Hydrogenimonas thermophila TaxID=223786 RepID=A0A1I5UES0_9BACT|nr:diguanylate cyclase [Hydrogenimonas thermophila]SFP93136.1 diguanylate cyclase (GGDEF) domain-containing protein [Hydrogenimonas thermophila]
MKKLNELTVMYVEDDLDAQEKIKMLLEDEIKELYQAFNGKEAINLYYEKKPDIILTDIKMPYLDGLEMAKKIKELDADQPIIVISGFDDKDILLKSINIGIDQFLSKPIDIELLFNNINNLMQKIEEKNKIVNIFEKENKNIYRMAYYDHITGAFNRSFFDLALEDTIIRTKRNSYITALFFIDLDNLKIINDNYGHKTGDFVLNKLVENIKKAIRKKDILCRIGGDEFSLIIEDIKDREYIEMLAKRASSMTNFVIKHDNNTFTVTCSIGISIFPLDCSTKEDLIDYADKAMYVAKKRGKASFEFFKKSIIDINE